MHRFPTIYLLLISVLGLSSCSVHSVPVTDVTVPQEIRSLLPVVSERAVYKAQFDVFGRHFSGLLAIKPDTNNPADYRVAFLSEMGITLLDMTYREGEFEVIKVIDEMDRKQVINNIQSDVALLISRPLTGNYRTATYKTENTGSHLLKVKYKGKHRKYYVNTGYQIESIREVYSPLKKTLIQCLNYQNDLPETILIKHKPVNLKLELNLIQK